MAEPTTRDPEAQPPRTYISRFEPSTLPHYDIMVVGIPMKYHAYHYSYDYDNNLYHYDYENCCAYCFLLV